MFCCYVKQSHVECAFYGTVVGCKAKQVVHPVGNIEGVFTCYYFCKLLSHNQAGILCFSYDHWKSRALANSIYSAVCMDPEQHILRIVHRAGSNHKGFCGDAKAINFGIGNLHGTEVVGIKVQFNLVTFSI